MSFGTWRRRLAPVVGAVILVVLVFWYGTARMAEEENKVANQRRATIAETTRSRATQTALAAERDYLVAHSQEAREMVESGFLEHQDRLAVSQAAEALAAHHRLTRLRFAFAPEEVIDDRGYLGDAAVIVSTPVSITLDAANEDDLYDFIDAVPALFSGVAVVESASIRRGARRPDGWPAKATLAIRWETLRVVADDAAPVDAGR